MKPAPPRVQRWPSALPALGVYLAVRVFSIAVLGLWSACTGGSHNDPHTLLAKRWDSLWYSRIANQGYGYEVHTQLGDLHSDLAFFPLMPALERLGHALTGRSVADVGLAVSVASSLVAVAGIYALVNDLTHSLALPRQTSLVAVILWAVFPVGIVQWMAYSESLFTALAAWALYCIQTRRSVLAGLLASTAGLTRPVGLGVILAVIVGVGGAVWVQRQHRGTQKPHKLSTRERLCMVLAVALAPLGLAAYVAWVGHRTGRGLSGYLAVQAGWRNGFDGGINFAHFIADKFTTPAGVAGGIGLLVAVALAVWGLVACLRLRLPLPILTYTVVLMALALGAKGYFGSKPRFFVPIFPLLIPLAVWFAAHAERHRARITAALATFAVASAVFGALWLNGSGPP